MTHARRCRWLPGALLTLAALLGPGVTAVAAEADANRVDGVDKADKIAEVAEAAVQTEAWRPLAVYEVTATADVPPHVAHRVRQAVADALAAASFVVVANTADAPSAVAQRVEAALAWQAQHVVVRGRDRARGGCVAEPLAAVQASVRLRLSGEVAARTTLTRQAHGRDAAQAEQRLSLVEGVAAWLARVLPPRTRSVPQPGGAAGFVALALPRPAAERGRVPAPGRLVRVRAVATGEGAGFARVGRREPGVPHHLPLHVFAWPNSAWTYAADGTPAGRAAAWLEPVDLLGLGLAPAIGFADIGNRAITLNGDEVPASRGALALALFAGFDAGAAWLGEPDWWLGLDYTFAQNARLRINVFALGLRPVVRPLPRLAVTPTLAFGVALTEVSADALHHVFGETRTKVRQTGIMLALGLEVSVRLALQWELLLHGAYRLYVAPDGREHFAADGMTQPLPGLELQPGRWFAALGVRLHV